MKSNYTVIRNSDGAEVALDPRFNIFTPSEIVEALRIVSGAKMNGGMLCDYSPDDTAEHITIMRKLKHVKLIEPTGTKLFLLALT